MNAFHRSRRPFAWLLLATCWLAMPARAVEPGGAPTLDEAVDAAWRLASGARHAEGESRRADAGLRVARSLAADTPALSWSREEGDGDGGAQAGATESEVGISWPLWMPGQRRAATEAARADVAWASANLAQARLDLATTVRATAWEIAAGQAELDAAQSSLEALSALAAIVERRVQAGDLATSDLLAARAGVLKAEAGRDDALRRLEDLRAEWRVLTGYRAPVAAAVMDAEFPRDPASLPASAAPPPFVLAAEEAVRRAEGEHTAVRRALAAPPELTLGAREESMAPGAAHDRSLVLAVRIPLGFGARRALAVAQARSALDVARADLALARTRHDTELAAARTALDIAERQLAGAAERADLLSRRQRMMQRAFDAGEIALSELLIAHRDSRAAAAGLARRQAERGLAHTRLLQATGTLR